MLSLGNRTVTLLIFYLESGSCRIPPRPPTVPSPTTTPRYHPSAGIILSCKKITIKWDIKTFLFLKVLKESSGVGALLYRRNLQNYI